MIDLDEQLVAFGRWLDTEIEGPLYVRPADRGRSRHRMVVLIGAVAASVAAALAILLIVRTDRPDPSTPFVPPPTTPVTTEADHPASAAPSVAPATSSTSVSAPADPSTTTGSSLVATTGTRSTPASSAAATQSLAPTTALARAPIPDPSASTTTAATIVTTTTTAAAPPATTAGAVCAIDVRAVRRAGTVSVRACADGIHFVTASVVNGTWTATPVAFGPPTVTVQFSSTSGTVYTCTVGSDSAGVFTSGDC